MSLPQILAAWFALSIATSLAVGFAIGRADRHRHAIERAFDAEFRVDEPNTVPHRSFNA